MGIKGAHNSGGGVKTHDAGAGKADGHGKANGSGKADGRGKTDGAQAGGKSTGAHADSAKHRAQEAQAAIDEHLTRGNRLRENSGSNKSSTAWPAGQAAAAALDLALLSGNKNKVAQAMQALKPFERPDGSYGPNSGGDNAERFYDDNAWIGLDFMQAYKMTGDKNYLHKAEKIFTFLEGGIVNGGLLWKATHRPTCDALVFRNQRSAVSRSRQRTRRIRHRHHANVWRSDSRQRGNNGRC
jgi:hypothetical protein